jgi:hypothetical protein
MVCHDAHLALSLPLAKLTLSAFSLSRIAFSLTPLTTNNLFLFLPFSP